MQLIKVLSLRRAWLLLRARPQPLPPQRPQQAPAVGRHAWRAAEVPGPTLLRPAADTFGSGPASWDSSSPLCPLHACLREFGVDNLAPFCHMPHLEMNEEEVRGEIRPKLEALQEEGITSAQLGQLLASPTFSAVLWRSYRQVFLPNLQLLQTVLVRRESMPPDEQPHLTALGEQLVADPVYAAQVLNRRPGENSKTLQWMHEQLGLTLEELAGDPGVIRLLHIPVEDYQRVCDALVADLGCSPSEMASLLRAAPALFKESPAAAVARVRLLQDVMGVSDMARLAALVLEHPVLLGL